AGAGLRDHSPLAHAPNEQALAHDVVRLVRAGVVEVLALDVDARAAEVTRQVLGERERRRPARVRAHELDVLLPECRVAPRVRERLDQLLERRHEDLRDVHPAEPAVIPALTHRWELLWDRSAARAAPGTPQVVGVGRM